MNNKTTSLPSIGDKKKHAEGVALTPLSKPPKELPETKWIDVTHEERIYLLKNPKKCEKLGLYWDLEWHKYLQEKGENK